MSERLWTEVDEYLASLFVGSDEALEAAARRSREAGLPDIQVSPSHGKLLHILVRSVRARSVLEVGTLGGYSAIWLARALPADGRLITLEADRSYAEVASRNLESAGLADVVEIRVGRAQETMPDLIASGAGPFDLVFIDADKESYPEYLGWALELSRPGTLIVADNVVREGAVIEESSGDPRVQAVRTFNEMLAADPRVAATVLQTVGVKGHDGLAVAVVL